MKTGSFLLARSLSVSALAVLAPVRALAVQQHGGAEGLVSHQIGHVLFFAGIVYLLYKLFSSGLKESGWFEFRMFLWLIMAWNFLTFSGHWMRELVDPAKFVRANGKVVAYSVDGIVDAYFYLTRLDHLLLFPAFLFLFLALQKWRRES